MAVALFHGSGMGQHRARARTTAEGRAQTDARLIPSPPRPALQARIGESAAFFAPWETRPRQIASQAA